MQHQDSQIETLHQEASSAYLQGEFQQALDVWRELLRLDPADERAKEGVRLCELLADEGDEARSAATATSDAPSTMVPDAPFAGASEGFDDDLEELDEILEAGSAPKQDPAVATGDATGEFSFDFSDIPEEAAAQQEGGKAKPELPTPDRQNEGIDFGNIEQTEPVSLGDGAAVATEINTESHAVDLPAQQASPPPAPQAGTESQAEQEAMEAAAAELRSRVNELLAEALTHYEQGNREDSLAVLNRIFILDENNDAALALHDNIRAEVNPQQAAPEGVEPTAHQAAEPAATAPEPGADEGAEMLPMDIQLPQDPDPEEEFTEETEAIGIDLEPESPTDDLAGGDPGLEEEQPLVETSEPSLAEASETRRTRDGLLTKQNLIIIVALVVVIGVGGGLAWFFMSGGGADAADEGDQVAQAGGSLPTLPAVPDPEPAADVDSGSEQAPQAPMLDADGLARVEALEEDARNAMDGGDYAAAVLAMNQALEIDPANPELRSLLNRAGEAYRKQREIDDRRQQAIDAFNSGNYRSALTIFYRLPEFDDPGRLDRFKRNGWFNMGLQALQAGDCRGAADHLKEARAIDPDDREILLAVDLVKTCRFSRTNQAYHDDVRLLSFRGLDD